MMYPDFPLGKLSVLPIIGLDIINKVKKSQGKEGKAKKKYFSYIFLKDFEWLEKIF